MKKLLLLSVFFISISSSAFAANKVYPLLGEHAIVADDSEWTFEKTEKYNEALGSYYVNTYFGENKYYPVQLYCFEKQNLEKKLNLNFTMTSLLNSYAKKMHCVFYDIESRENVNGVFIVNGTFLDCVSSGMFRIYVIEGKPGFQGSFYVQMFIKIRDNCPDKLDEDLYEILFEQAFDLITPLLN